MPFNCDRHRCLANFKDKFVFLFQGKESHRYSLAEDKWEKLPIIPHDPFPSACSLGDKVYVLIPESRAIKVLHNPSAPVSSQEMHWQDIEVPSDTAFSNSAFTPLNSAEIAISGGFDLNYYWGRDISTFDTTTCEFKKVVVGKDEYTFPDNKSANFSENTIVASV